MAKISVVINVIREEIPLLPQALASVKDFADEMVIVDMTPGDEVKRIAGKYKAKVYEHEFVNYVEPARNFGADKATGAWVLILDPDEELGSGLAGVLKRIVRGPKADYYRLPRKNLVLGKWLKHSRWWPDYNIRFFKKGKVSWNEVIHGVPMTQGTGADLEAREELAIVHHHYDSVEQFIERMNRYTTIAARIKTKEGYEFHWQDLVTRPVAELLSRLFAGEGYRDGVHGLALSGLQAFSEFVVYLKLWQLRKFEAKEIDLDALNQLSGKLRRDWRYWLEDALLKTKGGVLHRIRRKLRV